MVYGWVEVFGFEKVVLSVCVRMLQCLYLGYDVLVLEVMYVWVLRLCFN